MLSIHHLTKTYTAKTWATTVFNNFSLQIQQWEFVALVWPNGCWKSTLFSMIAWLEMYDNGKITFTEQAKKPGLIFQDFRQALFPRMNVGENILYPLKFTHAYQDRMRILLKLWSEFLVSFSPERYPLELSGGQQQLVNILRAVAFNPELLIMDEPFSAIDYERKQELYLLLQTIYLQKTSTILFITHNIDEAILLAQRIIILSEKPTRIVKEIYNVMPYPRSIHCTYSEEYRVLKKEILDTIQS